MSFTEYVVNLPFGLTFNELVGAGITGTVVRLDAVVKWVPPRRQALFDREKRVYERLQRDHHNHPRILRYYGAIENALILGYAQHGSIRDYMRNLKRTHAEPVSLSLRLRWIEQISRVMAVA